MFEALLFLTLLSSIIIWFAVESVEAKKIDELMSGYYPPKLIQGYILTLTGVAKARE